MITLRDLRTAARLTQDQLAAKAEVSQGLISQIEIGRVPNPQLDTLEKLAGALGVDIATLVSAVRASGAETTA